MMRWEGSMGLLIDIARTGLALLVVAVVVMVIESRREGGPDGRVDDDEDQCTSVAGVPGGTRGSGVAGLSGDREMGGEVYPES